MDPMSNWGIFLQIAGFCGGVGTTLVILTWWLSGQFSKQNERFFTKMDQVAERILRKLEYHEQHDDKRFSEIREDLAELRIRNAYFDARIDQEAKATNLRPKINTQAAGRS